MPPPGAPAAPPPQGGSASGPAEPVPRRLLDGAAEMMLAAALALPAIGPAQAESAPEHGVVSLKFLDYLDSQPGADRIRVRAPSLYALVPLNGEWSTAATVTHDSISGASPAYHTSALKKLTDERHAIDAEATRYFATGSVKLGASFSSEGDYVSRGLSVTGTRSTEDKNTTWTAGLGLARDAINSSTGSYTGQRKQVVDLLVGLTQVLGTHDIAQVNLAWRSGKGFFTDPYKVFDNRPRTRNSATLLVRWNHHLDATGGTLRSSYRWFGDTYGIQAHTLGFEYVQPLPGGWSLMPLVRLYTQSKARFYVEANADPDYPFPPNPPDDAVHYSEDQRVSAFGAHTWGLKLARQIGNDWLVDLKFEQYGQRASWRLFGSGSPRLAAFDARSWQLGITRQF
jgi:hypothetical protein